MYDDSVRPTAISSPASHPQTRAWRGLPIQLMGLVMLSILAVTGCQYESNLGDLACGEDTECPDGAACEDGYCVALPAAAQILLDRDTRTLTVGQSVAFEAEVFDEEETLMEDQDVQWESADEEVATVDDDGTVEALAVGTALITATTGDDLRASAAVVVTDVPVDSVVPETDSVTLEQGRQTFVAVDVLDEEGAALSGRVVNWASDDGDVAEVSARVDGTAVINAVGLGQTTVTVTSEAATATVDVEVTERAVAAVEIVPGAFSMTEQTTRVLDDTSGVFAQVFDDQGGLLDRDVTWETSDPSLLTIDDTDPENLLLVAGSVTELTTVDLSAAVDGQEATATITLRPFDVAAVAVAPAGISLEQYDTYSGFSVEVLSEEGEPISSAADDVVWESSDSSVVSVSGSGAAVDVEALSLGTAEIIATYDSGLAASAFVTVVPEMLSDISVSPMSLTITEGADESVSALATVDSGNAAGDRDYIWESADPTVASVNGDGSETAQIFGHLAGTTNVTAMVEGLSALMSVEVTPRALNSVVVSPANFELNEGQSFAMAATVLANDGRSVSGATVDWEVCDGTGLAAGDWQDCASDRASIDGTGTVSAQMAGDVSIRAVSTDDGTVTGEATLTVNAAPVINVTVSPTIVDLIMGDSTAMDEQLTAEVITTNGVDTDRSVSFTSGDAAVATVSQSGDRSADISAQAAGSTVVEAAADGSGEEAVGKAFITVAAEPVDALTVAPVDSGSWDGEVMVGTGAVALEAVASLRSGTDEVANDALWWSSNPAQLAVDADGQITGLSAALGVEIFAFYEGQSASLSVDVVPYDTQDIAITPTSLSLDVGEASTLSAAINSGAGCPVDSFWASDDSNVAVVDDAGNVVAVGDGSAQISVHCGDASASATVTVTTPLEYAPDTVAIEWVSPSSAPTYLTPGDVAELSALIDGDGSATCEEPLLWSSSDAAKAVVGSEGTLVIISGSNGDTVNITADCAGVTDTISVEIADQPDSVSIACDSSSDCQDVTSGSTMTSLDAFDGAQLVADVLYDGQPFDDCTVEWASADDGAVSVSESGVVNGANGDSADITATCGSQSDTVSVEIVDSF